MQDRTLKIIILLIIPMVLYLLPLPFTPLMEPDEGRYSAIPNEMNTTGDYVTPRLKGAVYFEKPPLSYWATALSFKIFGKNEFASRLFVALCAWGCILLTYRMGLFFHDAREGLYGAAVLSTFLFHAAIGGSTSWTCPWPSSSACRSGADSGISPRAAIPENGSTSAICSAPWPS
jgi:4-amino-4-deoxy-L-arabinose transferase-like glycosyltransferase